MTTIDLDALTSAARLPKVRLFGREMTVQPLTGAMAHRMATIQDADANGSAMFAAILASVGTLLPELTAEERDRLTVDQITAVVQISRGQIADVEQQIADAAKKN